MITKLNPNVIQDRSITAEKLADGIANDIISSLSTQSTLPSLTDYYIGQNAGGHTETYFKKTLQSIGSVFQHELYDKVYLKDGSDPTFGNITAWQLNLSENSSVFYTDGFGLALGVNDCAFLVGEEDGVYYLDAAGNTQTMLHSGNIGNYKLSQFTDDVVAGKYLPLSGGNIVSDKELILKIKNSSPNSYNSYAMFYANGRDRASVGYYNGLGYIANEISYARIGVTDTGEPQYWDSYRTDANKYTLLHSGNIGNYEAGSSVWSKGLDRITSITAGGHCAYFYSGQPTLGDNINNAKEGSNAYHLWSYPVNGTCVANGTANIMNLRLQFNREYLHDIFVSPNYDDVWHRSVISGTCNPWRKFAFTDSNVASATKLQTPRKLWGNDFDGTAKIGGDITLNAYKDGRQLSIQQTGGIKFSTPPTNGWATSLDIYANDKTTLLTSAFGVYGTGEYVRYAFIGGTYDNPNVVVKDDPGYVGIGTINPEERLHVIGTIKSDNLSVSNQIGVKTIVGKGFGLYSSDTNPYLELNQNGKIVYLQMMGDNGMVALGSTSSKSLVVNAAGFVSVNRGYVNPTEALDVGGNIKASGNITCSNLITTSTIVQTDNNSYIVHNAVSNGDHKMWITDGTGKSISAGNAFNLDAINIISDKSLVLGAQLDYNIRVLKANNRIAKVIDSDNYSTLLPYKTPVAISNTYSSDPHNVAMADNTLYIVYENEADDKGCTILSFPTNDGSTPLTCGLLYTTYADSTGEFSCPTVIWSYNITPLMEPEATFEMWFTSYDGGTTWYGTHTVYK